MNYLEKFRSVRTFIFDVDGVFTNGNIIVLENGHLLRTMNIRDGYAVKIAIRHGYKIIIISGGKSSGVVQRLRNLGVTNIHIGVENKLEVYEELLEMLELDQDEILYMGDDIPDYEVMRKVGLPVCPSDAVPEIKKIVQYISPLKGGEGCVRDVIEKVLKLNAQWLDEQGDEF
ncbi:MAG TPA: HAD hydrolase family protein [Saprospiraceae bacterium]|nr:HAD hydrolase family protein [Saprospiraceae bacterium]